MQKLRKNSTVAFAMLTKLVSEENFKNPTPITQKYIFSCPYVNFLHLAGLDVYPIFYNVTREQLREILSKVNGVMLPGGMSSVVNIEEKTGKNMFSPFTEMVKIIMEEAKIINDKGEYFPVFGICLGFESMIAVEADDPNIVEKKNTGLNYNASLIYTVKPEESKFLSAIPIHVLDYLEKVNCLHNYHEFMADPIKFANNEKLTNTYKILSLSKSQDESTTFVSMIEGNKYPFYAIQYHPELGMGSYFPIVLPDWNMAAEIGRSIMWFMLQEGKKNYHYLNDEDMKNLVANNPGTIIREPTYGVGFHLWD